MATRNLRSRTAEFADTNVNVEVECTGDSSYRQSEALNDEERGISAVSPLDTQDPVSCARIRNLSVHYCARDRQPDYVISGDVIFRGG